MKGLLLLTFFALFAFARSSLIASSKVEQCSRSSGGFEPVFSSGRRCSKKFTISLAPYNGQGESGAIYADIKFVENGSAVVQKHQLVKPFRITVTKSDVFIVYPLQFTGSTVNNQPHEWSTRVGRLHIKYHRPCKPEKHCEGDVGFCCDATHEEWIGKEYHYKRGHGSWASAMWSRGNSMAICAHNDVLWYRVFSIGQPYLMYRINVTVQQLDYREDSGRDVWSTVGYATIGPQRVGDNTDRKKPGTTSGPQVIAEWQGDFSSNSRLPSFQTKYLLVPDWRAAGSGQGATEATRNHEQIVGGPNEWLVVDKHLHDLTGQSCNKIGVTSSTVLGQENRCFQKEESCFYFTPRTVYETAKSVADASVGTHYFPTFYGDFIGIHGSSHSQYTGTGVLNAVNQLLTGYSGSSGGGDENLMLIYRSHDVHKSLVTLTFTAQSVSFVQNRSPGRIVEALVEDFLALAGSGLLTVTVQNVGPITSDYSVSLQACTDGIIQVSEKSKTLNPRQQEYFVFEISSSLNVDSEHNCTVMLTDGDGSLLDSKLVSFSTMEGCIYCPDGQCNCECKADELQNVSGGLQCSSGTSEYMNPFWEPNVVVVGPCYHCWFTDSFTSPYTAPFCVVVILLCFGMCKTLCVYSCCRTKDGRYFDVSSIILGTANTEHTWKKQRSATMQFLLGVCFFVYLPLLPLMIVVCTWRRKQQVKKELQKKAKRKHHRLMVKKKAALQAMKGLMVQDGLTVDEALKVMDEGQRQPDRAAPMLPPKVLVVSSSSSDTDRQDFNYTSSSDDTELPVAKKRTAGKRGVAKKKKRRKTKASSAEVTPIRRSTKSPKKSKSGKSKDK